MVDVIFISLAVNSSFQNIKKGLEIKNVSIDFDMTMSRHWVRNKETDALERNSSSHGIPARSNIMTPEV